MFTLSSPKTRRRSRAAEAHSRRRHQNRLSIERLEERALLTGDVLISIADATVKEQGNLSIFTPGNSAILTGPVGMAFGPDRSGDNAQDLYVIGGGSNGSNNIAVYDGTTGAFVEDYVPSGAGLRQPGWLTFDDDGNLYTAIASPTGTIRNTIVRVDHETQAVSTLVPSNANGGLDGAKGLAFGPDGNLYVASSRSNQVLRYNGTTGALIDVFVDTDSGLDVPAAVVFGPDQSGDQIPDLYVSCNGSDEVLIFDGVNRNTSLGIFVHAGSGVGLWGPHDMQFGQDGNLYVVFSSNTTNFDAVEQVFRFDGTTGAFIDSPVAVGSGLGGPTAFIAFNNQGELFVSGQLANEVLRYSAGPLVTLSEASTSPVTVDVSTANSTATQNSDFAAVTGRFTFAPGETSKRILVSPADDGLNEPSETFTVNLSNAAGATIEDGQGVVTIVNRQTKFFVIDDSPSLDPTGKVLLDKTYKYESGGASIVYNDLYFNAANVRGVASNLDGTKLWVIDTNGTVYVCDSRNLYLGSWNAGGLSQPEGITTNGTDIWIVDAGSDRVFKYAGAASRLSGSQSATSNFKLKTGNTDPKDIVTDGTYLWVVNDSSTDKVFRYKVATPTVDVKSWTISSGGGSPTGITIDPSNVSNIWIVDNNSDRVYQFNGAASRISGSQSPSTSFALAAGNTNPQGIADPPPAGSVLASSPAAAVGNDSVPATDVAAWSVDLATTASLGRRVTDRRSDSQRVVTARRGVDEFMGRLGNPLEPVRSLARVTRAVATQFREPATQRQDITFDELVGGDLDVSLDLIARDPLATWPSRRGR